MKHLALAGDVASLFLQALGFYVLLGGVLAWLDGGL